MKIPCSNCNQRLEIPEELAGQTIECPACKASLTVPTPEPASPPTPQVQVTPPQAARPQAPTPKRKTASAPKAASPRQSKSLPHKLTIAAVTIAAVVVLILFLKGGESEKTVSAWEEYKAASEAEGWKYGLKDYIGEIPPDDENFCMAKPFSGYLITQEIGAEPVYLNPIIKEQFDAVMNLSLSVRRARKNNSTDWGNFAKQLRSEANRTRDKNKLMLVKGNNEEILKKYFKQFEGFIGDLREATQRPKHYFPVPYENGMNTALPHLARLKGVTQFLRESSMFKLSRSGADEAMEDARLMFRLYKVAKNESTLIGQLVRIAIGSISALTFEEGQKQGGWSDTHLAEWNKFFKMNENGFKEMERAFQFERVLMIYTIESMMNGTMRSFDESAAGSQEGQSLEGSITNRSKELNEKDMIYFDSQMKQLITLAREASETGRINQNEIANLTNSTNSKAKEQNHILTGMLFPALPGTLEKEEKLMNQFSAARRR